MATYRLTSSASRDLDDIWRYHATRANVEVARRQIVNLVANFETLSEHPYIGVAQHELAPELRRFAAPRTRYIIYYFPTEYGVRIARVAHGRRSITSRDIQPSEES